MITVKRSLVVGALSATALGTLGAGSASAGEITGNGTLKPVVANSICAYSGQNDAFHIASHAEFPGDELNRVQSYGQIVRAGGKAEAPSPGFACNGHTGFPTGE